MAELVDRRQNHQITLGQPAPVEPTDLKFLSALKKLAARSGACTTAELAEIIKPYLLLEGFRPLIPQPINSAPIESTDRLISYRGWVYDPDRRWLQTPTQRNIVRFSPTEGRLFYDLFTHPGTVLDYSKLVAKLSGRTRIVQASTYERQSLRIYIRYLREKIGDRQLDPPLKTYSLVSTYTFIKNIPYKGYSFNVPEESNARAKTAPAISSSENPVNPLPPAVNDLLPLIDSMQQITDDGNGVITLKPEEDLEEVVIRLYTTAIVLGKKIKVLPIHKTDRLITYQVTALPNDAAKLTFAQYRQLLGDAYKCFTKYQPSEQTEDQLADLEPISWGGFEYDPAERILRAPGQMVPIRLSAMKHAIFYALLKSSGKTVPYIRLLNQMDQYSSINRDIVHGPDDVRSYITYLRQDVGDYKLPNGQFRYIQNEKSFGYRLGTPLPDKSTVTSSQLTSDFSVISTLGPYLNFINSLLPGHGGEVRLQAGEKPSEARQKLGLAALLTGRKITYLHPHDLPNKQTLYFYTQN
ncbi:hypothetical protein M1563_05025 [Patescibacteria group bacterium]|nr:hypothetical protein [Patescibacteria group bacterium]MCL5409438.1 hypothetical protein [Patescibacteria group bacterium]